MINFLKVFITGLLLAIILKLIMPWWGVAIAGFISGALAKNKWLGFIGAFLAVFVFWYSLILWGPSQKIAAIFGDLVQVSATALPIISACIGALISGIFGIAGSTFFQQKK